jgi:hypothetical protein
VSALLGLRLAVGTRRDGLARLVLTAVGTGLGVALILLILAAQAALQGRDDRRAWHTSDGVYRYLSTEGAGREGLIGPPAPDAALWLSVSDYYAGEPMFRIHVAPLGPRPPVPPGLDRLPAAGEVAVSPALRRLLAATPDDQLDRRLPGRVTTIIGAAGLAHPDQLLAVVGQTPQQVRAIGGEREVRGLATEPNDVYGFFARVALGAGAVVLLFPVVVFIVMVTRVAAAQREQRFAAIRLAGATRTQVALAAAAETGLGAAAGLVLGVVGYLTTRPIAAAHMTYGGAHFFSADFAAPPGRMAFTLAGLLVLTVVTTVFSQHRVQITPLGISRGADRRPPALWRTLPVLAGVAGLVAVGVFRYSSFFDQGERLERAFNFFLWCTMLGTIIAGPWACLLIGRLLGRFGRGATTLLAARRIQADARMIYRAVGGAVLAVFLATLLSSIVNKAKDQPPASLDGGLRAGVVRVYTAGEVPESELAPLMSDRVVVERWDLDSVVVRCADLVRMVNTSCPDHTRREPGPGTERAPVAHLYIPTDGSLAAEERVRTLAASVVPRAIVNTARDFDLRERREWADLSMVIRLVTSFIILVAACSLAVAIIGGLIERRRPFALLRASGVGLGELRAIVVLETALPMMFTVLLGAGLGLVTSYTLWRVQDERWYAPDPAILLGIGGGVLAALAATLLVLPLVNRTTRYDAVRFE